MINWAESTPLTCVKGGVKFGKVWSDLHLMYKDTLVPFLKYLTINSMIFLMNLLITTPLC